MKKVGILLMVLLLLIPHYEKVSAATIGGVPCATVGSGFCYYVNNPKKPELTSRLVEERAIPVVGSSVNAGRLGGYALSIFLSSPQGKALVQSSATSVNSLVTALGTQIDSLTTADKTSIDSAYSSMQSA